MARNLDFDGDLEIYPAGRGSKKYAAAFTINFDISPYVAETHYNPAEGEEVSVNAVYLRRNGEKVECPKWLEEMILDAVDEEVLADYANEDAE